MRTTPWHLLAAAVIFAAGIERTCAARGRRRHAFGSRNRRLDAVEEWVVITTTVHEDGTGKGKGKGPDHTNDSDDVGTDGLSPFPTLAPISVPPAGDSGLQTPPPTSPTGANAPNSPTQQPTAAPSSTSTAPPPTQAPTIMPTTLSPTTRQPSTPFPTIEDKAACKAAANKDEYVTDSYVSVDYLYELVSPADRPVDEVATNVDKQVQDFLVQELVECDTGVLSTVAGVGSGKNDFIVDDMCSTLTAVDQSQLCHLISGSVVLYFLTNGGTLSDQEGFDRVEEKLKAAYNGVGRRSLQATSFVNETLGILGLHYVGGRVKEDITSNNGEDGASDIVAASRDTSAPRVIPAAVVPVVLVACAAAVYAAVVVVRRRKQSSSDGFLLDGDESVRDDDRWKEIEVSKDPLQFKVVETTDESESSSSSGGAAAAIVAHEAVMGDLTGMTISESLSEKSNRNPVFLDPDAVTIYTTSHGTRFYYPRKYIVDDTVDI